MKVNMTLVSENDEDLQGIAGVSVKNINESLETNMDEEDVDENDEEDEDEIDESDKHSKFKTFLMVALMVGGFGLFVWNMTGLVNNMRLDSQGHAVNVVYDMEDLGSFMDSSDGSGSTTVIDAEKIESEVSTDAARDGPKSGNSSDTMYIEPSAGESNDMAELRKKVQDALNEAAFVKQELKNAEDMLDSSLAREAELQKKLNELTKGNQ